MNAKSSIAVAFAGACGTVLASFRLGDSPLTALKIAGVAGGAAVAVGMIGFLALQLTSRRSIAVQAILVALTPIGAVGAGAMAASHLMMEATRPIAALAVVLISSGTVGILASLALGARLRAGSLRLIDATRQIGEGDLKTPVEAPPSEEFAALARELEAMRSQLEQSLGRERAVDDARRKLVSWISHDLRTPLGRVRAIVEALNDGLVYKSEEVASYHAQLSDEIERLTTLVNDLFELNRISAGALELELECVDIGELVTELAGSFAVVADSRSITLNATDLSLDAAADVSPRHLERALSNLLDNALRYTHAGGAVDVSVLRSATNVQVAIDDTCGGTDVEMLATILAAPAEQTVLGSSGRTGLGLGIAQGLVQAQGGQIEVERTGRGCRFTVTLQLTPSVNPLHAFAPL